MQCTFVDIINQMARVTINNIRDYNIDDFKVTVIPAPEFVNDLAWVNKYWDKPTMDMFRNLYLEGYKYTEITQIIFKELGVYKTSKELTSRARKLGWMRRNSKKSPIDLDLSEFEQH